MIDDGVNGLLVPSGDLDALVTALKRLAGDPELCARMGEAASGRAKDFSEPVVMPQYEELYRRTIEHSRRRPRSRVRF
jgi:glycosyltransferase involved in cell wall biosynthesis